MSSHPLSLRRPAPRHAFSTASRLAPLASRPLRARGAPGRRGVVLVVALIFAALVAIALGSYLGVSRQSLATANRAFYMNAAVNLAETGLEEAMWSINQQVAGSASAWNGWTISGTAARTTFSGFEFAQNTTGQVRVYVSNATGGTTAPKITARGTITPPNGPVLEKFIEVQLRKRSKFANGLVAKDSIIFKGNNASVDSWNSDPDGTAATAAIPYSSGVRNDAGTAASISVSVSAVLIQNADIWGYAATGGAQPQVGSNGSVLGEDSPAGTKVDAARISTDFSASFDPVTAPTTTAYVLGAIGNTLSLPRTGDAPAADGKYYYRATSIELASSKTLTIASDDVVLTIPDGGDMSLTGNAGLLIAPGASLELYASGDVKLAGNGVANGSTTGSVTTTAAQQPVNFQIWGTATTSQEIDIKGNGALSGIVYAPTAKVFINGNGDVLGSVVAKDIELVGNAAFHYDESLGDLDTGNPYGITRWRELTTASDRTSALALTSF